MTDKPTGVFVRLPLSEDAAEKLAWDTDCGNAEEGLLAIGTPVTGGELEVAVICEQDCKRYMPEVVSYQPHLVKQKQQLLLVRHSDALAKLAEKDAEIARKDAEIAWIRDRLEVIRSYLTEAPAFVSNCGALEVTEEALKGPEE